VSAARQLAATPLLGRTRLQSPLTGRRRLNVNSGSGGGAMNSYIVDSSDDELMALSLDEVTTSENYRNLETFQKAQLNKKVCSQSIQNSFSKAKIPLGSSHRVSYLWCRSVVPIIHFNAQLLFTRDRQ